MISSSPRNSGPQLPSSGLSPIRRDRSGRRTSDLVLESLISAIRDLRLPPGHALSENALTEQFEVSRTPVREALARLVDDGLVTVVPQVGTRVARISHSAVNEAQFVREYLEIGAFERARRLPELDVAPLRALLAEQEQAYTAGDAELFFAADEALHRTLFGMAGQPGAWEIVERSKIQLDRLRRLTLPEPSTTRELIEEHTKIIDTLEQGADAAGHQVIRAHSRRALTHYPRLAAAHPDYFTEE
jgi:GntR family transcriptional regulator, rspAB operon transcriptional repressor